MMENKKFKLPDLSFLKKLKPELTAEKKREMIKTSILFAGVLFSVTLILGCLSNLLAPIAKVRSEAAVMDAMTAMFSTDEYKEVKMNFDDALGINSAKKVYHGRELLGYCIETTTQGYGGEIRLVVGIDNAGAVKGVEILSMNETPGYGDRVQTKAFLDAFAGKNEELTVVRKTTDKSNEITAVSGATVSSNAVKEGVNHAIAAVTQIKAAENIKPAEPAKKEEPTAQENEPQAEPSSDETVVEEATE